MIGLDIFSKCYKQSSSLVIFDLGAHIGNSVNELFELFPCSFIYAFEPAPENYKQLHERFLGNNSVRALNYAVGASDGEAILHRNNYDATHSLLPFDREVINKWADASDFVEISQTKVPLISLDVFCNRENIKHIDILKLDIQGGELAAFSGAESLLKTQSIGCIFSEVEFRPLYKKQPLFWDVDNYLRSFGYHFVNLVAPKITDVGVMAWADAVYVNDEIWKKFEALQLEAISGVKK